LGQQGTTNEHGVADEPVRCNQMPRRMPGAMAGGEFLYSCRRLPPGFGTIGREDPVHQRIGDVTFANFVQEMFEATWQPDVILVRKRDEIGPTVSQDMLEIFDQATAFTVSDVA